MADIFDQLELNFQNGNGQMEMLHQLNWLENRVHVVSNFYKVFYHWASQAEISMVGRYFQQMGVKHDLSWWTSCNSTWSRDVMWNWAREHVWDDAWVLWMNQNAFPANANAHTRWFDRTKHISFKKLFKWYTYILFINCAAFF